ncbi:MAG TPA: hypothetical protein VLF94_02335 [Chlamydiales bacterium]|nr:hypothetical protein [Chlamydiales bacterium]
MRKVLLTLLGIAVCTSGVSDETRDARRARMGRSAGYATRDATVLSMVGWGFGIAIGIAAISALIENNSSASTSH